MNNLSEKKFFWKTFLNYLVCVAFCLRRQPRFDVVQDITASQEQVSAYLISEPFTAFQEEVAAYLISETVQEEAAAYPIYVLFTTVQERTSNSLPHL